MRENGIYILLISVHGLIRGEAPELGRDPDTGGQVLYVLELAKALGRRPEVAQVDLLTRLVQDPGLPADYARPEEALGPHARIIRLPFGPRRYIRKELIWDHLDQLVDRFLVYARELPRLPDLLHSHYGDAGLVAQRLSALLGIPFLHTGHSLGRCKRDRLLQAGGKEAALERTFHFQRRIRAEDEVLSHAARVVASTRQEVSEQYGLYGHFDPRRAVIIPPGTDLARFTPAVGRRADAAVASVVDRFLSRPRKPLLLCIGRPVPSKNILGLVEAFGLDAELRAKANLLLVAGHHEDIRDMDEEGRRTWESLLLTLDRHDLFGSVAFPRTHAPGDIPGFYRLAAQRRGVYVNPSVQESFGLTLIEAAATGLPVVTTDSGGPRDIVANCRNGAVVESLEPAALSAAIREALDDPARWAVWARNGLRRVRDTYSWDAHVDKYLKVLQRVLKRGRKRIRRERASVDPAPGTSPFLHARAALICDLDGTLLGDRDALDQLLAWIRRQRGALAFGVATGRRLDSALWALHAWGVPEPDVIISGIGTEIRYAFNRTPDLAWENHIRQGWRREELAALLKDVPGLRPQNRRRQGPYKLSYTVRPGRFPPLEEVAASVNQAGLRANLVYSESRNLDVLPHCASKGHAVRYLAFKWGIPLDRFLVAGDSGNDRDMLLGDSLGIVVANHSQELGELRGRSRVYFASQAYAAGILEGIRHYSLRLPLPLTPDPAPAPPSSGGSASRG
ncbi:HAD-IIB family hydrolase [Mesoterricola silvestris]|uniref:sucrose-phosphate synthase n=1 Tax=Mesoterricola silvestris TaxID=2927979 RepID=A0AA48GTI2_9BACT|nr:HAD-IIB family hydrolase [Mesoterricola silvestris]BDU71476.1 sucrose-phosphate synthase [Mesoterricola silvestris]